MGGNALRTVEEAAAQVGATVEDIEALVATGRLRVLATADGRWITTARAVQAAVRGGDVRSRRSARARRTVQSRRRNAATATVRRRAPRPPDAAAPSVVAAPPPVLAAARLSPRDGRPDIAGDRRLDLDAAAAVLGITVETALQLVRCGELRATRLGRQWVTTARAVSEHLLTSRSRASR